MRIIEVDPAFREAVEANDGYCPCMVEKNEDTKCMCREFREQESGLCHCGRFEKVPDTNVGNIAVNDLYDEDGNEVVE